MKRFVAGLAILMCLASVFAGGGKEKASGKQVLDVIISQLW